MCSRSTLLAASLAALLALASVSPAFANATAPANGGSNLGGGQSGQCTGAQADRPAACGK
jgi:hypothetical protein